MKARVIGYCVSESKNGTIGTNLNYACEFDDYRRANALKCEGDACESEYIRGDYSDVLTIGETVDLVYGKGFQGKAVLRDIVAL